MTTDTSQIATNLPAQGEVATTVGPVVGGGELLGLGASMFVVVAIIVLLGWLYSRSRFVAGSGGHLIDVVATRALGPKERLMIVEVGEQQLLIGMTPGAVQTLHVFETAISADTETETPTNFAARLQTAFKGLTQ